MWGSKMGIVKKIIKREHELLEKGVDEKIAHNILIKEFDGKKFRFGSEL